MKEFVGLRAKIYTYLMEDDSEKNKKKKKAKLRAQRNVY